MMGRGRIDIRIVEVIGFLFFYCFGGSFGGGRNFLVCFCSGFEFGIRN